MIERIKRDPRVQEIWHEGDDGWWISLKKGYVCGCCDTHFVHEQTVADLTASFQTVKPCTCKECQ